MIHEDLHFLVQLLENRAWKLFFMAEEGQTELSKIRAALRYTQKQFADRLGIPEARYKNYEYGRALAPKALLGRARALSQQEAPKDVSPPKGAIADTEVLVPYIGKVNASSPADWSDPLEAGLTEVVPVHMVSQRGTFCCHVEGDSMMPLLQPDDLAIFKAVEFARTGSVVLYRHEKNGTVTIKQLKHDGVRPTLHPLNPSYGDEPADGKVIGLLIGYVRRIGRSPTLTLTASAQKFFRLFRAICLQSCTIWCNMFS